MDLSQELTPQSIEKAEGVNVIDSCGWLAYFAGEKNAGIFSAPIEDVEKVIVPTICLHEVFKVLQREVDEDAAFVAVAAMQQGVVVDLDVELSLESAVISTREELALADAVIYSIALKYQADLWTQDKHFDGKPGVRYFPKSS